MRQLFWSLKPLFFEVPTCESSSLFVGRQWLFREIVEHLGSDLPTNRGVVVTGEPGAGKTAVILQMVERSCFGRGTAEANTIGERKDLKRLHELTIVVYKIPFLTRQEQKLEKLLKAFGFVRFLILTVLFRSHD